MSEADLVYLRHMMECFRRIDENVWSGKQRFVESHTLQDAVLRNLQTLGESAQRLSEGAKGARPEIEWRRIGSFRNVLVHNYLGVDLDIVWNIVQRDIPALRRAITSMLEMSEESGSD